jgi:DNA-binding CsgD family transcriptional regulator
MANVLVQLSERQLQIVGLVAKGRSDKEIATALSLSVGTVKTYLGRVYRRNGFRNRAHAAAVLATRLIQEER